MIQNETASGEYGAIHPEVRGTPLRVRFARSDVFYATTAGTTPIAIVVRIPQVAVGMQPTARLKPQALHLTSAVIAAGRSRSAPRHALARGVRRLDQAHNPVGGDGIAHALELQRFDRHGLDGALHVD